MERQLRNTAQRKLVLDTVREMHGHPTADQVYAQVRAADTRISRGTVYRNLNILASLGELRRLSMPTGADHYDERMDNHYHFCCHRCGAVMDTGLPYNEALNNADAGIPGCRTEWHRLVLVGLCPECAAKE